MRGRPTHGIGCRIIVHLVDDHSTIKRKGVLAPTAAWLGLEDTAEWVRPTQMDRPGVTHSQEVPGGVRLTQTESRTVGARG